MAEHRYRYELAEEILRRGGSNEEIQRGIMQAFPDSKENHTRAQWYRRSFEKYGHCRGDTIGKRVEAWLENASESDPRFLNRVEEARAAVQAGKGTPLKDID